MIKSERNERWDREMNIGFDKEKLLHLIDNLYALTGIRADIYTTEGEAMCLGSQGMGFCCQLQAEESGRRRCMDCDQKAIARCKKQEGEVCFYRCHAGLCEAVFPIAANGRTLAYVIFGQFLDDSPREDQWQRTLGRLDWYSGSLEELRAGFNQLRQYSAREIDAYLEIVGALKSYVVLSGMIFAAEYSDETRLELYLDQHYMEKLTLSSISQALDISRTRLCSLAKSLPGGHTLTYLITQRRIAAAQHMLMHTDEPISAISEAVGIDDYNYFSKVFRRSVEMTPTEFRKMARKRRERYQL